MAEVAAALGVAAAIAQFVDIGLRCISQAKEVLQSADGLTKINGELRIIATDAEEQSALLLSNSAVTKTGSPLAVLLRQCKQVAAELTKELKWLQVDPASARKRDRTRALWRTIIDKDAIPQLERRLSSLRDQVCFHIVIALENHQRSLIMSVASMEDSTREWNQATTKKLDAMARDLQVALKGNSNTSNAMFTSLATELKSYSDQAFHRARVEAILKGLRFEHIRERESRVETAHKATFHWVFDQNSPVNLGSWLRTGNGTYWIEGKAGSGKSTMMKYLLQHEETSRSLQQWANGKELFIGSHFFWIMGSNLQKSQIGLLRTMLFQLLKRHPDLVPVACPDRLSTKNFEHLESWTMEALVQSFRLLLSSKHLTVRMCFFIDGLDEYSGIHTDLIDLLDSFAKSEDCIKICVSSRPWPEFREAYRAIPYRLCIHEFTRPDIHAFAHGRLTENPRFEALRRQSSVEAADGLVDEITARAEGVFLWVYYVVRSLLRGLLNRDDIHVLRTRVQQFPQELTDFFKHMFNAIDSVYKQQAAILLKVLAASDRPLPVLPLVFADMDSRALKDRGSRPSPSIHKHWRFFPFDCSTFEQQREVLTSRCRDLIHPVDMGEAESPAPLWGIRIGFLHRTVSDFISTSEMDLVLSPFLEPDFHPHVYLLHAFALTAEYTVTKIRGSSPFSTPPHTHNRAENEIYQVVKANLLDFLRLATHIHDAGDVNTMKKATAIFEELSPFWDDIFVPSQASKYAREDARERFPGERVPGDNNDWIARDKKSHSGTRIPMSRRCLLELGELATQELTFRPTGLWQLVGALGLTGYITACQVSATSILQTAVSATSIVQTTISWGPKTTLAAREATLGAFCRGAVLDDSENGFMQLQYTERWNIKALTELLSWWSLPTSPKPDFMHVLWQSYIYRILMCDGSEEPRTPKWKESLEMAKLLVVNGAKRQVVVPDELLVHETRATFGRPELLTKALTELLPDGLYRGGLIPVDCVQILKAFFGEKEAQELERMFCHKRDTAGS